MSRRVVFLLALLVSVTAGVRAQDDPAGERLRGLKARFRKVGERVPGYHAHVRDEQLEILREVAAVDEVRAVQFLVGIVRDPRHAPLAEPVLRMLVETAPDAPAVNTLMAEHMAVDDPLRGIAREFLLERAVKRVEDTFLQSLFSSGTIEDRFLALEAMGKIGSVETLESARVLAQDQSWEPIPGTVVNCGTIAASLKDLEGPDAARLLLLLERDRRFRARDLEQVREATRLWSRLDLERYIDIHELADRDPNKRAGTARFLGLAGIETARAPLLLLATNPAEPPNVREAAASALGHLRLARGALAADLARIARDENPRVRTGAILGLRELQVRDAAAALVDLVDGPSGEEARRALRTLSGEPEDTDWRAWLARCDLPAGT